jgi:FAD/FMN-containing dehydrogenase
MAGNALNLRIINAVGRKPVVGGEEFEDGRLAEDQIRYGLARKRWRGKALAVVRPGSTAEVAEVVRTSARHGLSIVAQGGNTGLVGGGVPDASGTQVVLSLARLNRIRAIDEANLTLTAEAGCVLQAVQTAAAEAPMSAARAGMIS